MPKIIDHDERRSEIVDVTWKLIIDGGIEAATMREIAAAAGFANGALKRYFACKEDIIGATYERALQVVGAYVAQGKNRGLAGLGEFCLAAMPIDPERIEAGKVLLAYWAISLYNPKLHAKYLDHLKTWRAELGRYLREGREDGDIVTQTPDAQLIDEIVLLNAGATMMSLLGPKLSTVKLQKQHLADFLLRLTRD
nr:TetR family transcriptional regulator C-terminal domain-containing protein [uncultured Roseateles sp.]